jgi:hypothetical protein
MPTKEPPHPTRRSFVWQRPPTAHVAGMRDAICTTLQSCSLFVHSLHSFNCVSRPAVPVMGWSRGPYYLCRQCPGLQCLCRSGRCGTPEYRPATGGGGATTRDAGLPMPTDTRVWACVGSGRARSTRPTMASMVNRRSRVVVYRMVGSSLCSQNRALSKGSFNRAACEATGGKELCLAWFGMGRGKKSVRG